MDIEITLDDTQHSRVIAEDSCFLQGYNYLLSSDPEQKFPSEVRCIAEWKDDGASSDDSETSARVLLIRRSWYVGGARSLYRRCSQNCINWLRLSLWCFSTLRPLRCSYISAECFSGRVTDGSLGHRYSSGIPFLSFLSRFLSYIFIFLPTFAHTSTIMPKCYTYHLPHHFALRLEAGPMIRYWSKDKEPQAFSSNVWVDEAYVTWPARATIK